MGPKTWTTRMSGRDQAQGRLRWVRSLGRNYSSRHFYVIGSISQSCRVYLILATRSTQRGSGNASELAKIQGHSFYQSKVGEQPPEFCAHYKAI